VFVARPHRIVALPALAAVLLALAAAGFASAAAPDQRHYPPNVRSQFTSSCVRSAKRVAGDNITRAKAIAYCRSALNCIERHLTLAQFVRLAQNLKAGRHDSHVSVMTSCERAAAKRVLG